MSFVRHAQFRNTTAMRGYFERASSVVEAWRARGPVCHGLGTLSPLPIYRNLLRTIPSLQQVRTHKAAV